MTGSFLRKLDCTRILTIAFSMIALLLSGCDQKTEEATPTTTEITESKPETEQTTTKITTGALDTPPPTNKTIKYSPYPQEDFPNQVFFGDTHLHTAYSADAGLVGATTTPDDAYRFAKGETVTSSNGLKARLQRPLDFLVVTRPN